MRIVWLCQYFAPEIGAPQARLLELSRVFLGEGHEVAAVTCFPNHPTGELRPEDRGVWARRDEIDGVAVFRCRSFVTPNRGFFKKTLGHLTFALTAFGGLRRAAREGKPDVVVISSPTFFVVATAWVWSRLHGVPWVFEVRDLWPGVFVELGVLRNRLLVWLLERAELFLYARSDRVVPVTRRFGEDIVRRGIDSEKVAVIPNGVDDERYSPGPRDDEFARSVGLADRFVVLYLGAHGISHALSRILDAAVLLRDLPDVRFVLVGEGAEKPMLVERAREDGLDNVIFHPGVPKEEVLRWYRLADVGLVPLRDVEIFTTFIPSKMFELMACGVPIVASVAGEAREILDESGGAHVVDPEDAEGIAREVRTLHADAQRRRHLGEAGRAFVLDHYTRTRLGRAYIDVLEDIGRAR